MFSKILILFLFSSTAIACGHVNHHPNNHSSSHMAHAHPDNYKTYFGWMRVNGKMVETYYTWIWVPDRHDKRRWEGPGYWKRVRSPQDGRQGPGHWKRVRHDKRR